MSNYEHQDFTTINIGTSKKFKKNTITKHKVKKQSPKTQADIKQKLAEKKKKAKILASYIQKGRIAKGYKQKQLAQFLSIKHKHVQDYENGTSMPGQKMISKLEKLLDINLQGKHAGEKISK